jgi:hypothetical protein
MPAVVQKLRLCYWYEVNAVFNITFLAKEFGILFPESYDLPPFLHKFILFSLIPNLYFRDVGAAQRVGVGRIAPVVLLPALLGSSL